MNTIVVLTLISNDIKGGSRNVEGGHTVRVYMYMERSDRAHTDADSYTCTQTEQSGNETTRMSSLDRLYTLYANEQHQYGFSYYLPQLSL